MEKRQAAHDKDVGEGKAAIDSAFSQFTPDYCSRVWRRI
jgi:hypothetical protein